MFWDEFPSEGGSSSSGNISGGGSGDDNVGAPLIPPHVPPGGGSIVTTTGGNNMQFLGYDLSTTLQSSVNFLCGDSHTNADNNNNNNDPQVEPQQSTTSTTQVDSPSLVGGGGGGGWMNPNLIFGGMSFNSISSSTASNNSPGGSSSMMMTQPSPTQQQQQQHQIVGVAQSSKTLLPSTQSSSQGDVVAAAAEGAVATTTTTTGATVQLQPPQPQLQQVQAHAYFMWLLQQQALAQQQQQQQQQPQQDVQAQLQQSHQQAAWTAIQAQQQAQAVQQPGEVGVGLVLQGHNVGHQQGQIIQRGGHVPPPPPPPPSVVATTTNNNGVPQQSSNPAGVGLTTSLPTLNASAISQIQLIQLLQLQQHQQQLQNAASQQQQQNNLMQQQSQLQSHQEAHQLKEAQQLQQHQHLKLLIKMQQQQQQQQNQQGVTPTMVQVAPLLNLPPTVAGTPSFLNVTTQQVNTGGYHPSLAAVSHSRRGGSGVVGLGGGSSLLLSSSPTVVPNPAPQSMMQGSTAAAAAASNNFRFISASETDGCGGDGGGGKRGPSRKRPAATKKRRDMTSSPTSDDVSADGDDYYGPPRADDNTVIPEFTTEEQRVRYNRERNREHAKNTRIRKKAYVERLKIAVDELCRERDTLLSERTSASCQMIETHSKRVDVLSSFFALRAGYNSSDVRRELWSGILDESSFTCRLPVTPYQSFPSSEVQVSNCQRTIVGVDAMIADAAANYVFLDSIVDRAMYPDGKIKFQYTLVTEESVVAGTQLMARWAMSTLNANQFGSNTELQQRGMLICKFNVAHKIVSIEIMFDVMAFMLQVKLAMGYENFNDIVIPNTVQTCGQKVYDYPMVITSASRPYTIIQVNDRWEKLTGYTRQEVVGLRSCSILQGVKSSCNNNSDDAESTANRREIDLLMGPVLFQRPSCAMMTNYTKSGRRYRQYLSIYPLSTDSNISHYVGLTTFVQWIDNDDETC